jgi:acetyl-CoA carboxylase biotin carboxyl carrier protein
LKKSTSKKVSQASKTKGKSSVEKSQSGGNAMDIELVKSLTTFMKDNDLVELDIKQQGKEIRLRRGGVPQMTMASMAMPQMMAPQFHSGVQAGAPAAAAPAKVSDKKLHILTSPFVGTFYRAAGPNQDNFVEEGKTVNVGDTLCIIEAMKLMNEIESDAKGRVVRVLVNNATPVEFGEPLFELELL